MKLEIGKWYINKKGSVKRIKKGRFKKLTDYDGFFYSEDGICESHEKRSEESPFDLIKEVRVTIEDVAPISELEHLKGLFGSLYVLKSSGVEALEHYRFKIMQEIERLQKLFEGE